MKKYLCGILIFLLLFLSTGCKKSIVGRWKSMDADNEYYYIFNQDKTCSYEMSVARLDCTYEIDDEKINILYKGNDKINTFKYQFEGDTLVIQDENGKGSKFAKIK